MDGRRTEIDYQQDSSLCFETLRDLPRPVMLESGRQGPEAGRYDILAADPYLTLITRGERTTLVGSAAIRESGDDPLDLLRDALGPVIPTAPGLPFCGGAIGYFGYDLGRRFERFAGAAVRDVDTPDMVVGLYDWAVVTDHKTRQSWLVSAGRVPLAERQWQRLLRRVTSASDRRQQPFDVLTDVTSSLSREAYAAAFEVIKANIRAGNCYQVNMAQRFSARVRGDGWRAYLALRESSPAPFSAYLQFPEAEILSSSPERFLRAVDGHVETKPIKGTRPRHPIADVDRMLARELKQSEKDRAENVMIVDLLRNDLGKSCEAGSVRVDRLFEIESFANVHQLVSTVHGRLRPGLHALDLLRGCFPGGSITGAPKLAAMRIIDSVEPHRRGVYCGSIGYVGFDGNMDTNIAIRTLVRQDDSIYAWAGGGIVADSKLESEYQESFDKAAAMLAILTAKVPAAAV